MSKRIEDKLRIKELETTLRLINKDRLTEGTVSVLNNLIRWGAIVTIFYFGYSSIELLAGKETLSNIAVSLLTDIKISVAIAWTAAGGGLIYGLRQKKLRKDTVERLQGRIKELELRHDPNRTSSDLTPRGETRPEDEI